jgi:hypothetical protein
MADEDESPFNKKETVLSERFVLISLLGRGGFSEVYKV